MGNNKTIKLKLTVGESSYGGVTLTGGQLRRIMKKLTKKEAKEMFSLSPKAYIEYALEYFNFKASSKILGGIKIDGERNGHYVLVWPYWDFKDAVIDEGFLYSLHSNIRKRVIDKFYIIAPVSYVYFMADYLEIDDVKYYFLKFRYDI